MRGVTSNPDVDFKPLRARLERLRGGYNPHRKDRLTPLPAADGELYSALVGLARDGYKAVWRSRTFFLANSLYDDGMFWYELFLSIIAASERVEAAKAQAYIPARYVDDLLKILVRISRFSVNGGDITKRNHEALGGTLLCFYDKRRVRLVREAASKLPLPVKRFVKMTIARVEELRAEPVPIKA